MHELALFLERRRRLDTTLAANGTRRCGGQRAPDALRYGRGPEKQADSTSERASAMKQAVRGVDGGQQHQPARCSAEDASPSDGQGQGGGAGSGASGGEGAARSTLQVMLPKRATGLATTGLCGEKAVLAVLALLAGGCACAADVGWRR